MFAGLPGRSLVRLGYNLILSIRLLDYKTQLTHSSKRNDASEGLCDRGDKGLMMKNKRMLKLKALSFVK